MKTGENLMPRYYFHVEDDRREIDQIGVELPDLQAARQEAVRAASEILRDGGGQALWSGKPWRMWVTEVPLPTKALFSLYFSAKEGT
jgi:hypothetical protein